MPSCCVQVIISLHLRLKLTMKWSLWLAFLFISLQASGKCTCAVPNPKDIAEISKKFIVVRGKVLKIEPLNGMNWTYDLATVEVEEYWYGGKTELDEHLNIYSGYGGTCAFYFEVGESYLIYLYDEDNIPSTSICTPTMPLAWALEYLLLMGPGKKPVVRSKNSQPVYLNNREPEIVVVKALEWANKTRFIVGSVIVNILLLLYIFRKRLF